MLLGWPWSGYAHHNTTRGRKSQFRLTIRSGDLSDGPDGVPFKEYIHKTSADVLRCLSRLFLSGQDGGAMNHLIRTVGRRSVLRALAWATTAVAAGLGSVEIAEQWKEVLLEPHHPASLAQDHGSSSEINRDATMGTVQTVTGNVAQDYSRNLVLYNNAFRVEVVRATDDASPAKRQVRDQILSVLDGLVDEVGTRSLSDEQARTLGRQLGTILDAAPISPYRLQAREFTLQPGTAYFLPERDDSFTFVGPAKDGAAHTITVRRNGRESTMTVGAVKLFRKGARTCRLLLHEVAADISAATFSYACGA